jgi:hypothetical protein
LTAGPRVHKALAVDLVENGAFLREVIKENFAGGDLGKKVRHVTLKTRVQRERLSVCSGEGVQRRKRRGLCLAEGLHDDAVHE